jgi:hypothetical protein
VAWIISMLMTIVAYRMKWWRKKLPEDLARAL